MRLDLFVRIELGFHSRTPIRDEHETATLALQFEKVDQSQKQDLVWHVMLLSKLSGSVPNDLQRCPERNRHIPAAHRFELHFAQCLGWRQTVRKPRMQTREKLCR